MTAFGSSNDTRHLEKHGRQYRAKLDVPKKLRAVVGKAALKKALGTDSLTEAQRLRWPALAELRKQLHDITRKSKTAPLDPLTAAAIEDRVNRGILVEVIAREERPEDVEALAFYDQELFGAKAERIEREHSPAKAHEYQGIVRGERTPITVHVDRWINELQADGIAKRTAKHYRNCVIELAAFAGQEKLPLTLEAFGRRHAGDLISKRFIQPKAHHKTAAKFISALSTYWRWLESRGLIPVGTDNPWLRQPKPKAPKPQRGSKAHQKERLFTDDELMRLLDPKASAGDVTLSDFMLIAALSGMRIEEIASLRVEDVDLNTQTMAVTEAKTDAGVRIVPIHPNIADIIKRRIADKSAGAWLFRELPEYPPESLSERSMIVSKRFVTFRRALGVDERVEGKRRSLVNFHSFRRWFITKAEQADIPPHIIASVVGHETGREGMTLGTYSGGPSIEQRRACVKAVKLPKSPFCK
jgi:integrase